MSIKNIYTNNINKYINPDKQENIYSSSPAKYQDIVILLNQNKLDAESHACLC